MEDHYSFKNAIKNPYMQHLNHEITIRLDDDTMKYLEKQSDLSGIPEKALVSILLSNCAKEDVELPMNTTLVRE